MHGKKWSGYWETRTGIMAVGEETGDNEIN
jgi:hypothetical protein